MRATTINPHIEITNAKTGGETRETIANGVGKVRSDSSHQGSGNSRTFSYKSLSSMFRVLGASALVTSLSIFLFQGWADGDDMYRFAALIGFSGMLALAGLMSSHVIQENIGARLFLGISLLSVVVNFAVAGGLVYSGFQSGVPLDLYPEFARWEVATTVSAFLAVVGAVVVLAPVSVMGFRALARHSSKSLVKWFLVANAALLVPIRDGDIIMLIVSALTILLINRLLKIGRSDTSLATKEGRFAQAVVLAPIFVMLGRLIFVYSPTAFIVTSMAALLFAVFRQIGLGCERTTTTRKLLDHASVVAAFCSGVGATAVAAEIWPYAQALSLPLFSLIFAGLLVELSVRSVNDGALLRRIASIAVVAGISTNLCLYPSVLSAMVSMCVGLLVVIYGYSVQQKLVFAGGLTTLMLGFGYQLWVAARFFEFGGWGSLAILGTVAILLASVLERYGLRLREQMTNWRTQVSTWDA